ncbi:uncharacterized protein UBRO_20276 [Ustilago bromivora]|uniref:Reverse transcriptase domain-containing protein n=1 Tax=Ustilago bromivora TaxID=307758 RepID=A0A1K0GZ12_9BASI|nr:uncharacterized protein UBRO_20276 [Ustilago bromivora]
MAIRWLMMNDPATPADNPDNTSAAAFPAPTPLPLLATSPVPDPTDPVPTPFIAQPPLVLPATTPVLDPMLSAPPALSVGASPNFVTCSDFSASIGELHQFLQDEIVSAVQAVTSALLTSQPAPTLQTPYMDNPAALLPCQPFLLSNTYQSYPHTSDILSIYDLPKLANPLWPGSTALEEPAPVLIEGFSVVKGPTTSTSNHQFIKAVPNFLTFGQLWVIYLLLRVSRPIYPLHQQAKRNLPCTMTILATNRSACLETRASALALTSDPVFRSMYASPVAASTHLGPASKVTLSLGHLPDCPKPTNSPCEFPSLCRPSHQSIALPHEAKVALQPQPHTAAPPPPQSRHIPAWSSGFPMWPSDSSRYLLAPAIIPASQLAPATLTFSSPLQVPLADLASAMLSSLQTLLPPAWPNTTIAAPLHPSNGCPSQYGTMQAASSYWTKALLNYLDHPFVDQLLGAIDHSVHLGYSVGTAPKPHSTRLLTIHHLSHPHLPHPQQLPLVNDGIATHFTMIHYASLTTVLEFVRDNQGCHLWKSNLTDAFWHVVTTLDDTRLLGFTFDRWFYMETGLTFRGQISPWLFNLSAEALHWILQSMMHHPVDHYLDDFFRAVPAAGNPGQPLHALALACLALGLQLVPQKTFWNHTKLEILSIEVDTVRQCVGIIIECCSRILDAIDNLLAQCSAHLIDWQHIAGLLQFVSLVVPHGKVYLRRLHDASKAAHRCHRPPYTLHLVR